MKSKIKWALSITRKLILNKKMQFIIVLLIFSFVFAAGYIRSTKGINFTDEGFYIASAMRYSFGDIPFKDEFMTHLFPFDKVVAPVFFLFPDITLLQIRLVGVGFNILTLLVFCLLISKYINPIIAALLCSLMFFLNHFWGISSPSYNSLASNFGILSFTCLMYAFRNKNFRTSTLLSILSSIFMWLTIISYSSAILMPIIPFLLLVGFYLNKSKREVKLLIIFLSSFALLGFLLVAIMALTGILPIFIKNYLAQSSTRDIAKNLLFTKLNANYTQLVGTLRTGLSIIGVYIICFFGTYFIKDKKQSIFNYFLSAVLILATVPRIISGSPLTVPSSMSTLLFAITFLILNIYKNTLSYKNFVLITLSLLSFIALHYSPVESLSTVSKGIIPVIALFFINLYLDKKTAILLLIVFFILAILNTLQTGLQNLVESIVLVACILISFINFGDEADKEWQTITRVAFLWFVPLGLIFAMSSADGFHRLIQGVSPLIAIGLIGFYRFHQYYEKKYPATLTEKAGWRILFFYLVFLFVFKSYSMYRVYLYNEVISEVTVPFTSPVLKGVYSTPKKVAFIDELLTYLQPRVKRGDYFLTYYYSPMLYFLTHTRPSYGEVWADEDSAPFHIRKQMAIDMVRENKQPEYVVRMMVHPGHHFKDPFHFVCEDNNICPLDAFLHKYYYIDKIIYPFQIWRKGPGPILKNFEKFTPNLQHSFAYKTEISEPANLFFSRQPAKFAFSGDESIVVNNKMNKDYIQLTTSTTGHIMNFGYVIGKDGIDIPFETGDVAVMTVEAQVKHKQPAYFPIRGFIYINEDMSEGLVPERNDISIYSDQWEGYVVSKKVRQGTRNLNFIVNWQPAAPDDWMNIKNIKIYILKNY